MIKRVKKRYLILGGSVIIVSILLTVGLTYGKYATNAVWNYYLGAKGFYFTSDYLSMENTQNVNQLWDGEKVYFSLSNSDNELVATNFDISYEVTCEVEEENTRCYLNGTTQNVYNGVLSGYETCKNTKNDGVDVTSYSKTTCEIEGYTWQKEIAKPELYFEVFKEDGTPVTDATVKITAISKSPYKKTLTGTFLLHRDSTSSGSILKSYTNNQYVEKLYLTNTYNEEKEVTISFDSQNHRLAKEKITSISHTADENGYINSFTIKLSPKESKELTFYKTDFQATYDETAFIVQE